MSIYCVGRSANLTNMRTCSKQGHLFEKYLMQPWHVTQPGSSIHVQSLIYMHISTPMDPLWCNMQVKRFQSELGKRILLAYFWLSDDKQTSSGFNPFGTYWKWKHVEALCPVRPDLAKATLHGWWATSRLNWTGLPWTCWKETSSRQDSLMMSYERQITDIHRVTNASRQLGDLCHIFEVQSLPIHVEWMHTAFHCRAGEWCNIIIQIGKPPLSASWNPDLDLHLFFWLLLTLFVRQHSEPNPMVLAERWRPRLTMPGSMATLLVTATWLALLQRVMWSA